MVRILMISAEFSPNPPTPTRVSTLAKMFAREKHSVTLLSNSGRLVKGGLASSLLKNLLPTKTNIDGVTWLFPPAVRTSSDKGLVKALEGLLSIASTLMFGLLFLLCEGTRPDIIYSSTAQSQGLIGSFMMTVLGRPLVVNYGDPAFVRDTGIVRRIERFFEIVTFSKADLVFATDPVIVGFVRQEYGKKAIFLPNGYDADLFQMPSDSWKASSRLKIIVFVGKIDLAIYRLDVLLRAMSLIKHKFPDVRLRVIGDGPDKARLKSLATQLKVERLVEFVGLIPHEDVPRWLADSFLCVHITNDMCTGIKVSEYMAAKKPVVIAASWWNNYNQFLRNGFNCFMVPLVAEELARAIIILLTGPFIAQSIAMKGFQTVSPWTWEAIAQKKLQLMAQLKSSVSPCFQCIRSKAALAAIKFAVGHH
jgi:glycosyltransferase involved in cell wall biosynthesis